MSVRTAICVLFGLLLLLTVVTHAECDASTRNAFDGNADRKPPQRSEDHKSATTPPPPFVTLFEAVNTAVGPYPCTRIPSGLALPNGIVLAFAECRRWVGDGCFIHGMHNDSSAQYFNRSICLRRSLDGGTTWEPLQDNITERYSSNPSAVYVRLCVETRLGLVVVVGTNK